MKNVTDWNSNLYDSKHEFVSQYGLEVVDLLNPQKDEVLLDLGCGTGDITAKIAASGANVIGVDASKSMIDKAKEKYPQQDFWVMDATKLNFSQQFDGVFSNAVLHWIKEPRKLLEQVYSVLKPKGRLVAEFGGKGNVETLTNAIIASIRDEGYEFDDDSFPWYFPTIGEYTSLMESVGFTVKYAVHFDRPTKLVDSKEGMKDWIKMFGSSFFANIPGEACEKIIDQVEIKLRGSQFIEGSWWADYKRIRVVGMCQGTVL